MWYYWSGLYTVTRYRSGILERKNRCGCGCGCGSAAFILDLGEGIFILINSSLIERNTLGELKEPYLLFFVNIVTTTKSLESIHHQSWRTCTVYLAIKKTTTMRKTIPIIDTWVGLENTGVEGTLEFRIVSIKVPLSDTYSCHSRSGPFSSSSPLIIMNMTTKLRSAVVWRFSPIATKKKTMKATKISKKPFLDWPNQLLEMNKENKFVVPLPWYVCMYLCMIPCCYTTVGCIIFSRSHFLI